MSPINYDQDSEVLKALGHYARLKIVSGLMKGNECSVNNIVEKLNLPQSTVSQHLKVLKTNNIITSRKEGVKTCYRVIDERVKRIVSILEE